MKILKIMVKSNVPFVIEKSHHIGNHGIMALGQHVMFVELIGKNHEIKTDLEQS